MPITIAEDDLTQWLTVILRSDYPVQTEGTYVFTLSHLAEGVKLQIPASKIQSILTTLSGKQEENETALFDGKSYERLVREEASFRAPLFRRDQNHIEKEDVDNGLTYRLSAPSDEYLVFLLAKINAMGSVRMLSSALMMHRMQRFQDKLKVDDDVLNALKISNPRLLTVRVTSKKVKSYQEMSRHSNAFLFQLTYNLDIPIVEARYLDDLIRSGRVSGRRSHIEDIDVPKRVYIPDLVYHYQMAVATDSPLHEYLSYYHIAEHFFEEVYNDDLINSIRNRITHPSFSYRRKKDIQDLISDVNKRIKIRNETVIFNEQEALKLTLQKYIKFDELLASIKSYDSALVDYYKNNQVSFSGGIQVDLENPDSIMVADNLAKRIYKTRNSIVHSKESEKGKYVPFEHDKILVKEVPLLRFIAEGIIIETSTIVI